MAEEVKMPRIPGDIGYSTKANIVLPKTDVSGYSPISPTEYNRKLQEASFRKKIDDVWVDIRKMEKELESMKVSNPLEVMDLLEKVIFSCGGEKKLSFLEVTGTFIRVATRVPMTANLFQFSKDEDNNPKFHNVVTKILLHAPFVTGVRWFPNEEGAMMVMAFKVGDLSG